VELPLERGRDFEKKAGVEFSPPEEKAALFFGGHKAGGKPPPGRYLHKSV